MKRVTRYAMRLMLAAGAAITAPRVFAFARFPKALTYDGDGNMTSDGRFTYTWNAENRMVMASNAEVCVTYAYDHRGRIVRKDIQRRDAEPQGISYLWDNWNIVRETRASGLASQVSSPVSNVTHNVWGLDLAGTLQGATTFTHRFSTKPWCPETGFCDYQMRKYCPDIGRWDRFPNYHVQICVDIYDQNGSKSGENCYGFTPIPLGIWETATWRFGCPCKGYAGVEDAILGKIVEINCGSTCSPEVERRLDAIVKEVIESETGTQTYLKWSFNCNDWLLRVTDRLAAKLKELEKALEACNTPLPNIP